ncbi:YegP family protein [Craterilacuibacter sinensis]|uniref:DUF1508 domain-containing protein n=1 Tax=Craterilacuibacter sinensis TaxID=2686017 RepID=A0A845BLF8_9NEIS|nr:YegP family protein [Craterilacuibacter sinensis]MXR37132.1 DUF1508 domain-containing protein [Craterilacuibacter sinensis]RQW28963.1 DUF1508 domain-containing protein [Rhodobacteraceae bacterium CH30]
MSGKFEVSKSKNGKYLFNLKAGNGQIILTSQLFDSLHHAIEAAQYLQSEPKLDARIRRKISTVGDPYFSVLGRGDKVLARSEMYSSSSAMERGIDSLLDHAPTAQVIDTTAL